MKTDLRPSSALPTAMGLPGRIWRGNLRMLAFALAFFAAASLGAAELTLTWSNNSADLLGFVIQRSTAGGSFTQIAITTTPTVTTYVDSTVVAGTNYSYQVAAYNSIGTSAFSNVATNASTFTTTPTAQTAASFGNVTFTAAAIGVPAPSYQWQFNNVNLVDGGGVSGSATATLTLSSVSSLSAGNYTVIASNGIAPSASSSATLAINEAAQSVSVASSAFITYSPSGSYNPGATATSGETVTYSSSNTAVATTSGSTVTIVGAGTTTLTATAAGDVNYLPASATQQLTVNKATQTITFPPIPATSSTWGTVTLTATSSSGLPITYTSENLNVATVNGSVLTIVATSANFADIDANQSGNANYLPANQATQVANALPPGLPLVTGQPTTQSVVAGTTVNFSATSIGTPTPTYQWEVSTNGGTTWTNLTNSGVYSGVTSGTLVITGPNLNLSTDEYRYVATNTVGTATSSAATLTVTGSPPVFGTQPVGATVVAGNAVTFTASATGLPTPTLQWQVSSNSGQTWSNVSNGGVYSGVTTGTLTISNPSVSLSADEYRAIATNAVSSTTSNAATLTVNSPPAFSTQPLSATILTPSSVTFTAVVTGQPTPTLQWQVSSDSGQTWSNLSNLAPYSGVNTATLTITSPGINLNADEYQLVATNLVTTTDSNAVVLTVNSLPSFTTQPLSVAVTAGSTATFTAVSNGSPAPTVQWQVSTDHGVSWSNLTNTGVYTGVTTGTLTITNPTLAYNSYQYREVATNLVNAVDSNPVVLTVNGTGPVFTTEPVNTTVLAGTTAVFTAVASGVPAPSIQWQVSTDNGATWTALSNSSVYSGVTTGTLTITNPGTSLNAYLYQAVATNTVGSNSTNVVSLSVEAAPGFATQPVNQTVVVGGSATFTAAATGLPAPTLQWQVSTNSGASWTNLANSGTYSGVTTASLTITNASLALGSNLYQVVATNAVTSVTSNPAALTVESPPSFTTQPVNATITVGGNATFTAAATAQPAATLQWQVSTDHGATWTNLSNTGVYSGVTTGTLSINGATISLNSYQYQLVATNLVTSTASAPVILTVNGTLPVITSSPPGQVTTPGSNVTFTVTASGIPTPTFQWQKNSVALVDGGEISGSSTATLTLTGVTTGDSGSYTATATNSAGTSSPSTPATLTVSADPVITSASSANGTAGSFFNFTLTASASPLSFTAIGLPSGLTLASGSSGVISGTPSTAGTYTVDVGATNNAGAGPVVQMTITIGVAQSSPPPPPPPSTPPSISLQPASQSVAVGGSVTFTVAASATSSIGYQWTLNGVNIAGATGASLTLNNAQAANAGSYAVVVTSSSLSTTSQAAVLTVISPPVITTQPVSQTVAAGSTVTFSVVAQNAASYQWQFNGTPIASATSASLMLAAITSANTGSYTVAVENTAGSVNSNGAVLAVQSPGAPAISTQPQSLTMAVGASVVLSVSSSGTVSTSSFGNGNIRADASSGTTYQWYLNGVAVPGGTNASLLIPNLSMSNAGSYDVLVTNSAGSSLSAPAVLSVSVTSNPGRLINLSTLSKIQNSLTMGFVTGGAGTSGSEPLLIRAVGPSIGTLFNLTGVMTDPTLAVVQQSPPQSVLYTNAGWGSPAGNVTAIQTADAATGAFPLTNTASLDSALAISLPSAASGYSVIVKGQSNDSGSALAEVYDNSTSYTSSSTRLINLSCLTQIAAAGTLDVGFVIGGSTAKTVLIRASGPALNAVFGITGVMSAPQLLVTPLSNSSTVMASNAGWAGDSNVATAAASVGAFAWPNSGSADSAALVSLSPGNYTVQVTSAAGGGGQVLVEIYDVP